MAFGMKTPDITKAAENRNKSNNNQKKTPQFFSAFFGMPHTC